MKQYRILVVGGSGPYGKQTGRCTARERTDNRFAFHPLLCNPSPRMTWLPRWAMPRREGDGQRHARGGGS